MSLCPLSFVRHYEVIESYILFFKIAIISLYFCYRNIILTIFSLIYHLSPFRKVKISYFLPIMKPRISAAASIPAVPSARL